jgi:hypothetical protein
MKILTIKDRTDPEAPLYQNQRALASWYARKGQMATGVWFKDPLASLDRVAADYDLALKRVKARDWLGGRTLPCNVLDLRARLKR